MPLPCPPLRRCLNALALGLLVLAGPGPAGAAGCQRTEDVVYGHKDGMALTMDVLKPTHPNGYGVIFLASGGWFSSRDLINLGFCGPFLDQGYTVFAVVHGSQPRFFITEILGDVHRAVRFIRHNAAGFGVRPDRLGLFGTSAGGHLSLMIATQGGPGGADAKDPVDRETSAVAAVACIAAPTDFLNFGGPGLDGVGVGLLKDLKPAFGPRADTAEGRQLLGRELSPVYAVTDRMPPCLLIHGEEDPLVPVQQARSFVARAQEVGAPARLIVKPGAKHGWPDMNPEMKIMAGWFDTHLRGR